jgi:hypothetical protein
MLRRVLIIGHVSHVNVSLYNMILVYDPLLIIVLYIIPPLLLERKRGKEIK